MKNELYPLNYCVDSRMLLPGESDILFNSHIYISVHLLVTQWVQPTAMPLKLVLQTLSIQTWLLLRMRATHINLFRPNSICQNILTICLFIYLLSYIEISFTVRKRTHNKFNEIQMKQNYTIRIKRVMIS